MNVQPANSIFVHIPKCAGMSMEAFCIENGIKIAPLNRTQEWCDRKNGSTYLDRAVPPDTYGLWDSELESSDFFTFAFVRNPWDRMVSAWRSNVAREFNDRPFKSFLDFIFSDQPNEYQASHVRSYFDPSYRLFDEDGRQAVDFIGRFERLHEDFNRVCQAVGLPARELSHINQSSRGPYGAYYDEESRSLVEARFERDIAHFGYEFEAAESELCAAEA